MQDSKPVNVPFPVGVKLSAKTQEEEEDMSRVPYASVVGSLMYAMVCSRPETAHVVGVLGRFMSNPGKEKRTTVKRVFRYLHGTSDYGLCYQGRPGLERMLDIRDLLMQTGMEIWTKEDIQVGMCLAYLEAQSVG